MSIVIAIDSPGLGGSEKDLIRLLESLRLKNYSVLHASKIHPELTAYFASHNIPTFSHPVRNSWRHAVTGIIEAHRWLRQFPAHTFIVWSHHCESHRWLQLALAMSRRRFIVCERFIPNTAREAANSWSRRLNKHFVARRAYRVVVCGHDQGRSYHEFFCSGCSNIQVIPNTRAVGDLLLKVQQLKAARARLRETMGLDDGYLVVCVGRLAAQKDQATLIRAIGMAASGRRGKAHLALVGEGEDQAMLQELALKVAPKQVTFTGQQCDPLVWLAAADVFALSSLSEGLPGALIEALAAGLPCIATDIPGNRELVRHEETGLLVPLQDAVAMAAALNRLLANPAEARRLGEAGHRHVLENYDEESEFQAWRKLFVEIHGS